MAWRYRNRRYNRHNRYGAYYDNDQDTAEDKIVPTSDVVANERAKRPALDRSQSMQQFLAETVGGKPGTTMAVDSVSSTATISFEGAADAQEFFVPFDVIMTVFKLLPRAALDTCRCVCKYWLQVGSDQRLAWRDVLVFSVGDCYEGGRYYPNGNSFNPYPLIDDPHGKLVMDIKEYKRIHNTPPVSIKIVDRPKPEKKEEEQQPQIIKPKNDEIEYYALVDKEGDAIGYFCFSNYYKSTDSLMDMNLTTALCHDIEKFPGLWDLTITETSPAAGNSWYHPKRTWSISVIVNIYEFETLLLREQKVEAYPLLTNDIFKDALESVKEVTLPGKESFKPPGFTESRAPQELMEQPGGLSITLHKYQRECVHWMKSVEDSVPYMFKYLPAVLWPKLKGDVVFNFDGHPTSIHSSDLNYLIFQAGPRGGILADEMGLGKTMSVLGLILSNQLAPEFYDVNPTKDDTVFRSRGTLVICPNHLVKQWKEELEKNTKPPIKVIPISTIAHLKKIKYQDLVETDVVVVSVNVLFKNKNYMGHHGPTVGGPEYTEQWDHRAGNMRTLHKELLNMDEASRRKETFPVFDMVHWRRIVLDEGHEVLGDPVFHAATQCLKSDFKWYVTGTPFPNMEVMNGVINWLAWTSSDPNFNLQKIYVGENDFYKYQRWLFIDLTINNMYWRNTKDSAKEEYKVPTTLEDVKLLDFHPVERALYESAALENDQNRMRMLCDCAHLHDRDKKLFSEGPLALHKVHSLFLDYISKKPDEYSTKIAKTEKDISEIEANLPVLRDELSQDVLTDQELSDDDKNKEEGEDDEDEIEDDDDDSQEDEDLKLARRKEKLKERAKKRRRLMTALETEEYQKKQLRRKKRRGLRAKRRRLRFLRQKLVTLSERKTHAVASQKLFEAVKPDVSAQPPKIKQFKSSLAKVQVQPTKKKSEFIDDDEEEYTTKKRRKSTKKTTGSTDKKPSQMKVADIQKILKKKGIEMEGKKAELVAKLEEVLLEEQKTINEEKRKQFSEEIDPAMTEYYGTKTTAVIHHLQKLILQDNKAKVLLFSQFTAFLKKISHLLDMFGIEYVSVEGNVHIRNKAITAFKDPTSLVQVLLLSLENAASGTNLMEATHVLIMDAIGGTRQEAKAIEDQAIGRAHRQGQSQRVTVVRFVIKDTIEHEQYKTNLGEENVVEVVDDSVSTGTPQKPKTKLVRTDSFTTYLANTSPVKSLSFTSSSSSSSSSSTTTTTTLGDIKEEDAMEVDTDKN